LFELTLQLLVRLELKRLEEMYHTLDRTLDLDSEVEFRSLNKTSTTLCE
jgi:hypothetical protein